LQRHNFGSIVAHAWRSAATDEKTVWNRGFSRSGGQGEKSAEASNPEPRGPRPAWLIWPLALFFGLLHWPQGAWGVVGTTLAAIALSVLFLVTGSLWPPLAAHYVLDVSQVVVAKWMEMKPLVPFATKPGVLALWQVFDIISVK
jgi:hypothetical protein